MAAPTVFRWSDTGAPTLNNTAGSIISVLDFCLPSRGWVKEFAGTNKAVYRAGSGNRKYYRILDDNSSIYSSLYHALITGYDSMTDVDTGAGWGQTGYIKKSYNDTTAKRWVCVVDEKGFMLLTQPYGGTSVDIGLRAFAPHYVGETVPALPGQSSRDVIACGQAVNLYNTALTSTNYATTVAYIKCNRSLDSLSSNLDVYLAQEPVYLGRTSASANTNPPGNFTGGLYNYPYNGELLYCKCYLIDKDAYSIGDYIPWLYFTPQKGGDFVNGNTYSADGKSFIAVYISPVATTGMSSSVTASNAFGVLLIAITDER